LCGGVVGVVGCGLDTESILNRIGKDVAKASLRTALVNFMIGGVSLVAGYLHPFGESAGLGVVPHTMASVSEADGDLSVTR
jgi:hypothetical protein